MLKDLAVSSVSLLCGVNFGFSCLCLPAPQDQSVQGGQSYLPVHHSSWLRHHVSRGTVHPSIDKDIVTRINDYRRGLD
jgi:hypothetical protein